MKKTTIALVGLGYWGPNILRNLQIIKDVEVSYCCDLDKNKLNKVLIKEGTKLTTNYKEILDDARVDAVIISTPLSSHYSLAMMALKAGKHVLVEKPFTQKAKDAEKLINLARHKKLILMVGHTFVYSEAINKIKKIITNNGFGNLNYYDSTRTNLGPIKKELNVIWDLAPHDFSILNFIYPQKPLSIYAFGETKLGKKNEEIAHVLIRYPNKTHAHLHISWLSPVKIRTTFIGGTKQFIKFDDIEPSEKITVYNKGITVEDAITPFAPAYRSGDAIKPYLKQKESLANELEHFVNCIKNKIKPITDGEEGLRVVRLLEATDKSLKLRKEIKL